MTETTALAFLGTGEPPGAAGYGAAFARLRWRRAVGSGRAVELSASDPAQEAFEGAPLRVVVLDSASLPLAAAAVLEDALPAGRALAAARLALSGTEPAPHTLREVEALPAAAVPAPGAPPAVAFRISDFPPRAGESAGALVSRVLAAATPALPGDFAALVFGDPSDTVRQELAARIPADRRSLADVGCGAGATSAFLESRTPGLTATGIEKNPQSAQRARSRLRRVLTGDAASVLAGLAADGERFDAFLVGDVLEHTADPIAVLSAARTAARPGAVLVASVPNVGHLSLVRDLVLGRFDPVPAGLADAGHLRWFTEPFLREALEEAGWTVASIEGIAGAAPPDAAAFLEAVGRSSEPGSLGVYQWIAVATAGEVS